MSNDNEVARSAETGKFVTKEEAEANPNTTVVESIKRNMYQDRMLQFFEYEHLPQHLQDISRPFGELAKTIVDTLPMNPERTVALRKLLEAKDCAVRARLYTE